MNHVQQAAIGNKIVFVFEVPHLHAQFVVDCSEIIPYLRVLSWIMAIPPRIIMYAVFCHNQCMMFHMAIENKNMFYRYFRETHEFLKESCNHQIIVPYHRRCQPKEILYHLERIEWRVPSEFPRVKLIGWDASLQDSQESKNLAFNGWNLLTNAMVWVSGKVSISQALLPRKLTYPMKIGHPQRKFIFQPSIFRGHVSFGEG